MIQLTVILELEAVAVAGVVEQVEQLVRVKLNVNYQMYDKVVEVEC